MMFLEALEKCFIFPTRSIFIHCGELKRRFICEKIFFSGLVYSFRLFLFSLEYVNKSFSFQVVDTLLNSGIRLRLPTFRNHSFIPGTDC